MSAIEDRAAHPEHEDANSAPSRRLRDSWKFVALGLFAVLVLLVVYPQIWILVAAVGGQDPGGTTLSYFAEFFAQRRFRGALINSVSLTVLIGLGATLVAVPLAFVLARYRVPARDTIITCITMATVSPPFLGAYAWVLLMGNNGVVMMQLRQWGIDVPFNSIIGPHGIVWVGIWFGFALVFLLAYDAFASLDGSLEEAGLSVGARPFRVHWRMTLPLAAPAIVTGLYLATMRAFSDFGTPLLIGGGHPMLPTVIYFEFLSEVQRSPAMASAASVVMVMVSVVALVAQRWYLAKRSFPVLGNARRVPQRLARWKTGLILVWIGIVLLLAFVPHLTVIFTSFLTWRSGIMQWEFTLDNYSRVLSTSLEPIFISFALSGIATLLMMVAGVIIAYIVIRKRYRVLGPALNTIVMLPYIISGTVLAIGLILAFNSGPIVLTGTAAIIVVAYFIRRLPYMMKSVEGALTGLPPSLEEAAMSVGATSRRAFRDVTVPLIKPSVLSGGAITFLQTITELSATIMLYATPWITMTVVIFRNTLQPGSPFGQASAMTVILLVSVYVPLYFIRRRYSTGMGF